MISSWGNGNLGRAGLLVVEHSLEEVVVLEEDNIVVDLGCSTLGQTLYSCYVCLCRWLWRSNMGGGRSREWLYVVVGVMMMEIMNWNSPWAPGHQPSFISDTHSQSPPTPRNHKRLLNHIILQWAFFFFPFPFLSKGWAILGFILEISCMLCITCRVIPMASTLISQGHAIICFPLGVCRCRLGWYWKRSSEQASSDTWWFLVVV